MWLDESHPLNAGILRHTGKQGEPAGGAILMLPDEHKEPYAHAGSHPDVVQRVWDGLGPTLPADSRALVNGHPALVHPVRGIVIGMCYGTQYIIRVTDRYFDDAVKAGCRLEQKWTGGGRTDLVEDVGKGWLFGCWARDEGVWLNDTYQYCDISTH